MVTEKVIIDRIKSVNGEFTTKMIAKRSGISNSSSLLYKVIKKLLNGSIIELVQEGKGREPAIYRVKQTPQPTPVAQEAAPVDQEPSFENMLSITDGSIRMEDFGNAIFDKMLRLGADLSEKTQQVIHQQQAIENHAKEMNGVREKLTELCGCAEEMQDVDIFTLIAHITNILTQERAAAAQANKYHEERKQHEKLKKTLESTSNLVRHLETKNGELRKEIDVLKNEIRELTKKINTNSKGQLCLSSFRDLGKALEDRTAT